MYVQIGCLCPFIRRGKTSTGPILFGFIARNFSSAPSSSSRLAGKVAVITGAASGIGAATARKFVRNGAKVIIADVQDDLGRGVAAELGPDVAYTRCDVTDEAQIAAAVDLAVARHGRLDVLHNNAGIPGSMAPTLLGALDAANFDRVMAVNARAVVLGIKHAARVMVPRRSGCVLCTASVADVVGDVSTPAYCISKATVIATVRAVAGELARRGVRVNANAPHGVLTPQGLCSVMEAFPGASAADVTRMFQEDMNELAGTVLEVEDIARAAVYLASDEAKYITGHSLVIDGGYTVGKRLNVRAPQGSSA